MKIDWESRYSSLPLFVTGRKASEGDLAIIRAGLRKMLSQREKRIRKLSRFVSTYGIQLDGSYEEAVKLCNFFIENIEFGPKNEWMSSNWLEFCIDTGVFIGEVIRTRVPNTEWGIVEETWDSHPDYHEIGILKDTGQYIPIYKSIIVFGNSVLLGHVVDDDLRSTFFARMMFSSFSAD